MHLVFSLLYDLILATVTDRELSWLYKLVQLLLGSYILNIAWISGKRSEWTRIRNNEIKLQQGLKLDFPKSFLAVRTIRLINCWNKL